MPTQSGEMLTFYGKTFSSRLLIGTALYPSPAIMQEAIRASCAQIVTVSLRRETAGGKAGDAFLVAGPRTRCHGAAEHRRSAVPCAKRSRQHRWRANCSARHGSSLR